MLIKDALFLATEILENFSSKQLEARILLADILNISHESLLISYNEFLAKESEIRFFDHINRRKNFEPIAYIIGKKEFYSLNFLVNRSVLIPRSDTEILVDCVINSAGDKALRILELGTGSGAIAVGLATSLPEARLVATDISLEILELAKRNSELNNVYDKIEFVQSDWYENLLEEKFDFIVSNPPYISVEDTGYMSEETLCYEPKSALFADNNGIINYEIIISKARNYLKNDGKIFLEIGFNQSRSVAIILNRHQFTEIQVLKDLGGNDRVIMASY